jgi:PTS system glucitol/sorbitol-specific IIA component
MEIDARRYTIRAVGEVANENLRNLGHLVLKANGETTPELPGDVCIEALPLPEPFVGMRVRIWDQESKDVS